MIRKLNIASPFCEPRGNYPLDMIVIHHIGSQSGKLYTVQGTITWFTNVEVHRNKTTGAIENKVSSHYIIPREPFRDSDVIQLVKDDYIAYHAGESQWTVNGKLRKYNNRYSVGIELEGDGNLVEYTDYQYGILTDLIQELSAKYNIPEANIVGHEDIAPGRKVDPGRLFDWKRLRQALAPKVVTVVVPPTAVPVSDPPSTKTNPPKVDDAQFFMGDGSKTHSALWSILLEITRYVFKLLGKS